MLKLTVLCICVGIIYGYPSFLSNIPNANKVKNPCPGYENTPWKLLGHRFPNRVLFHRGQAAEKQALIDQGESIAGRSFPLLNVFGEAYKSANFQWALICNLDSDGDGLSNGAELGDPNCVFASGTPIGHPGICDNKQSAMPNCVSPMNEVCPPPPSQSIP
ncbi:temptin-like [Saccostrea cucullata]|uniref:temptin-like n=1 Tax=Saccostrea cuccullata TaxID=36930 RepID=UPI002ED228AD